MFEDSTFESAGRIRTRSTGWMIAAFTLNSSILLSMILIPLIYPEALPRMVMTFLMPAPAAPVPEVKPQAQQAQRAPQQTEINSGRIQAPSVIPNGIRMIDKPEAPPSTNIAEMNLGGSGPAVGDNPFGSQGKRPVVHQETTAPVRVSSKIVEGLLLKKTVPVYPTIAKAMGVQGTVVLQAAISRNGTIENLHVVSGPAMLQQAAMDAVRTWRYRPYLLNGDPVEVETTVNVIFTLHQ
jgi:protein TonB